MWHWATSKLAWRIWRTLMEDFELSPDSMAMHLTLHQLTVCYRLFQSMLAMFDTALRGAVRQLQVPERGAGGWATSYDGSS
jgi:hypothetical protein